MTLAHFPLFCLRTCSYVVNDALAEQAEVGSPVQLPFQHLHPVHMSLDRAPNPAPPTTTLTGRCVRVVHDSDGCLIVVVGPMDPVTHRNDCSGVRFVREPHRQRFLGESRW